LLAAVVLGASCGPLKETPASSILTSNFYNTDLEVQQALNGAWEPLIDYNLYKQPSWIEAAVDDPYLNGQNWFGGTGNFNGVSSGVWYVARPWTGNYQMISATTIILNNMPKCTGCTPAGNKLAAGQAHFLRAWSYFDVATRYGPAVIRNTPYQLGSQTAIPRGSLAQTYTQIVSDLKLAIDSLPTTQYANSIGGSRPTAIAAWALLAKVYLYMAGQQSDGEGPIGGNPLVYYDSARAAALNVINNGYGVLEQNYWTLFDPNAQKQSFEILWTVNMSNAGSASGSEIADFFAPPDQSLGGGQGQGFIGIRRDFYNTFEPGDVRVAPNTGIFIHYHWGTTKGIVGPPAILQDSLPELGAVKDSVTAYYGYHQQCRDFSGNVHLLTFAAGDTMSYFVSPVIFTTKYIDKGAGSKLNNGNDIHLVRYADVLLMFAEAENEVNGPTAAAFNALNKVRARAGLAPSTASGQAAFRQAVWTERDHELFAEGMTKWDLIREGRWLSLVNAPSTAYPADGPCASQVAYQQLYPLPQSELSGNPSAHQNPGF
jgi:hypothetical protein